MTFLCAAEMLTEMLFTVSRNRKASFGLLSPNWGSLFNSSFLSAALRANMPVVVAAVHEHAAQMRMSQPAAVEYLAGQFMVEARWLAAPGVYSLSVP